MTIEHAPSTNGRVHTSDTQPGEPRAYQAPAPETRRRGAVSRFIMPIVLAAVALFVLRRLNKGNVV
jgi:hypothetical protein